MTVMGFMRSARFAAMLVAGLALGACANNPTATNAGYPGNASPGSPQDFVVNVGDRVFFEVDSSELTPQAAATLDKQAQWLGRYNRYAFTVEGHADERGTREYNIALGARRAQAVRDYLDVARRRSQSDAHHLLRQGAAGRGLQRHLLLVAEPPFCDGAQRKLLAARSARFRAASQSAPLGAPILFCGEARTHKGAAA